LKIKLIFQAEKSAAYHYQCNY